MVILLALTAVTYRQIGYWQNDVTLWTHSAEVSPGNWKAEFLLGLSLDGVKQPDEAVRHYYRAAAINPTDPFVNQNIAMYEHQHGHLAVAIEYYKKALPQMWSVEQRTQVLTNMASAYRLLGDTADADACLDKMKATPAKSVDWQGAWWKQIIPMIKGYFHPGSAKPQS